MAILLAENGAKVIVHHSSSENEANETVDYIIKIGGTALAIKADVSQRNQVTDFFDKTIETFGKLDVLINNAGIIYNAFLKDNTQEGFIKLFDVNVKGIFNTLQEANNLSSM